MTRMTGPDCAVMCNLINTHTHTSNELDVQNEWEENTHTHTARPGREEDTARLGQTDAKRLGGRHAGRTDLIPLR